METTRIGALLDKNMQPKIWLNHFMPIIAVRTQGQRCSLIHGGN